MFKLLYAGFLAILVLTVSITAVTAQEFKYHCVDPTNFQKNYLVNLETKSILHETSFDGNTKKKYNVRKFLTIFNWSYGLNERVWTLSRSSANPVYYTMILFDFKMKFIYDAAIIPQNSLKNRTQTASFKCRKAR